MEQVVEQRRVARVGWLIGVAAALRLLPLARLHPIAWDEIEYFRATDWVRRGLVPYRDFWEHHTPLQWFLFAPVAALTKSPGAGAILLMRWAQVPLWIVTFLLLAKWMRRAGASALASAIAVLCGLCSTLFMLGAIEYRVDVLGCALYVAGLFLLQRRLGFAGGAALCLAGFANIRLGPLLVLTILLAPHPRFGHLNPLTREKEAAGPLPPVRDGVVRGRVRVLAGAAMMFAACAGYFLFTHSAAIAFRRVWTENYLADRLSGEPPLAMFRRLAAPFGFVSRGFDIAAVDAGTMVIFTAGAAGLVHLLLTRWRERDDLFVLAVLQIANIIFIAAMKFVYHYHFMIIILLALPMVAHVCDRLLARGRWREVITIVMITIAVSAFASIFRGKEDDLDYQDLIMREAHRLTQPGARVFDGVGYAIRREPAYRYWFLAQIVRTLEARGVFERYDIAADPPDAVIADLPTLGWLAIHPQQAEFVRRHYRPRWPELWLPGMSARLTPERPGARWVVPADGTYRIDASARIRLAIDGVAQPPSDTLTLHKRQRLEASAETMKPIDIVIVPAGEAWPYRQPPPGVSLDAVKPPVTHVPRLW